VRLPRREWPLVGRRTELATVSRVLASREGAAVVLAGPAGVGKSRLVAESMALAERAGFVTLRAVGTKASVQVAFGALAALLPWEEGDPDPAAFTRRAARAIADRGEGRPVLLVVDDAHFLDDASATLVGQVATGRHASVALTLRDGEVVPAPITRLLTDGIAERIDLPALDADSMAGLLREFVGGPVERRSQDELVRVAAGNALLLRELVLGCVETGRLIDMDGERRFVGEWRLVGALPLTARLIEVIESRLGSLGDEDRAILEVLALAEPVGIGVLGQVVDGTRVDALSQQGFIVSRHEGRRLTLQLSHPLQSEVLRAGTPITRSRVVLRALADATESLGGRRREDLMRVAMWRLAAGGPYPPDRMLAAAQRAHRRQDYESAERLARAAVTGGAGFDAAVLAASAAGQAGRGEQAERELAALTGSAGDDEQKAALAFARVNNLYAGGGRVHEALRVAEDAMLTIGDVDTRAEIGAWRAIILRSVGRFDDSIAALDEILAAANGRALVLASLFGTSAYQRAGRLNDAVRMSERGLVAQHSIGEGVSRWPSHTHTVMKALSLVGLGHLADAELLASAEYAHCAEAGMMEGQADLSWPLAEAHLAVGRAGTAARWAREGVQQFSMLGSTLKERLVALVLVRADALTGQIDEATRMMERVGTLPPEYEPDVLQARAWLSVASGDIVAARGLLLGAVATGRDTGQYGLEVNAAHDLVRLGDPGVVDRLRELADLVDGELMTARAMHGAALAAGDGAALVAAATAFESLGAMLLAAEATAQAAVAFRRQGANRAAASAEQKALALAAVCEGARTPSLNLAANSIILTSREREVAMLAASGLVNREIAERLGVSKRTIDNQLQRIYEKLGVSGRQGLGPALTIEGSPSMDGRPPAGNSAPR
jgi:DNA-binding CsgD family transcriptional regulator